MQLAFEKGARATLAKAMLCLLAVVTAFGLMPAQAQALCQYDYDGYTCELVDSLKDQNDNSVAESAVKSLGNITFVDGNYSECTAPLYAITVPSGMTSAKIEFNSMYFYPSYDWDSGCVYAYLYNEGTQSATQVALSESDGVSCEGLVLTIPASASFSATDEWGATATGGVLVVCSAQSDIDIVSYIAFKFTFNTAPSLTGASSATAQINTGIPYTLDLSSIFTDAQGDPLTYTVSTDDGAAASTGANFSATYDEAGTHMLVFTANDGSLDSPTYTVNLTVNDVPNTAPALTGESSGGASVRFTQAASLDLSTIFADADTGDVLTYYVSDDMGESWKALAESDYAGSNSDGSGSDGSDGSSASAFSYKASEASDAGFHFFQFKATDIKRAESPVYTYAVSVAQREADVVVEADADYTLTEIEDGVYLVRLPYGATVESVRFPNIQVSELKYLSGDPTNDYMRVYSGSRSAHIGKDDAGIVDLDGSVVLTAEQFSGLRSPNKLVCSEDNNVYVRVMGSSDYDGAIPTEDVYAAGITLSTAKWTQISVRVVIEWDALSPNAPTLVSGVSSTGSDSVTLGDVYALDLSQIFTDADGDALSYTVAIDGADAAPASAGYIYTPATAGTHTLVFAASDPSGNTSTDTYTLTLDVAQPSSLSGGTGTTMQLVLGATASIDLSGVFEGAASHVVSIDGAEATPCESPYAYTPAKTGKTTLAFQAADAAGSLSEAYTVTLMTYPVVTADVAVRASDGEKFIQQLDSLSVSSDAAEKAGFADEYGLGVTALDVLVAANAAYAGCEITTANVGDYLNVSGSSWVLKAYGVDMAGFFYCVDGKMAVDESSVYESWGYTGYNVNQCPIYGGETIEFFSLGDTMYYSDSYAWFESAGERVGRITATVGDEIDLALRGYSAMYYGGYNDADREAFTSCIPDAQLGVVGASGEVAPIEGAATGDDGAATVSFDAPGTYVLTATTDGEETGTYILMPYLVVEVVDEAPEIKTLSIDAKAKAGESFSYQLEATGENVEWSVAAGELPDGLALGADGKIAGKAQATGTWTFKAQAQNSGGADVQAYRIEVENGFIRLGGDGRYDTMAEIVGEGFESSDWVVVASGAGYADALAASPLAGRLDAPIVLTDPAALSAKAKAEIERLGASSVVIVGGESAVSSAVEGEIAGIEGVSNVKRLAGEGRLETALAIYNAGEELGLGDEGWGSVAVVASGYGYADALSISPYGYAQKAPMITVDAQGNLTEDGKAALAGGGFDHVVIVGGESAVSAETESYLEGLYSEGDRVIRLGGANRYETSKLIAQFAVGAGALSLDGLAVAYGENFPDALAGAALCGQRGSVLLLADDSEVGKTAIDAVIAPDVDRISVLYYLGGTGAVKESLAAYIESLF